MILHDGYAGDFVMMSAAIRELRRLYPNAHIAMMVTPKALNLAEHCPYVDELSVNRRPWEQSLQSMYHHNLELAEYFLSLRLDAVYAFAHFPNTILLAYMSGARERISFDFSAADAALFGTGPVHAMMPLLTVKVPMRLYGTHNIDKNLGLLDHTLHAPLTNRDAEVWFAPSELYNARAMLKKYIGADDKIYALCMGGSRASKKWAAKNYAELCKMILAREPNVRFVIIGGGNEDRQHADEFKQHLGDQTARVLDLTDQNTFQRSAALLSLCDMYIGNETGTLHVAAAVKVPALVPHYYAADLSMGIHSAPKIAYPYGVPSVMVLPKHALEDCRGSTTQYGCIVIERPHCIAQIEVETAFEGYRRLKDRIAQGLIEPMFMS